MSQTCGPGDRLLRMAREASWKTKLKYPHWYGLKPCPGGFSTPPSVLKKLMEEANARAEKARQEQVVQQPKPAEPTAKKSRKRRAK